MAVSNARRNVRNEAITTIHESMPIIANDASGEDQPPNELLGQAYQKLVEKEEECLKTLEKLTDDIACQITVESSIKQDVRLVDRIYKYIRRLVNRCNEKFSQEFSQRIADKLLSIRFCTGEACPLNPSGCDDEFGQRIQDALDR